MQEQPSPSPETGNPESNTLALGNVKCDNLALFKLRADGGRVLEFPLDRILDLTYESKFKVGRILMGLAWIAGGVAAYLAIDIPWIKWPLAALCAVIAFGTLTELHDKLIKVRAKDGEYVVDVEDSENDYDARAFVKSVQFRVQELRGRS